VRSATDDYRAAEDVVGQYIDEATKPDGETSKADLYAHFLTWEMKNGIKSKMTSRKFNERISERGDISEARTGQARIWRGISRLPLFE
jgi:phage/plasmid-associated DNA primase